MNARHMLIAATLLLLGSTTGPVFAAQHEAAPATHSTVKRPTPLAIATSYFGALNHQGAPGHNYQTLKRLYEPGVTLTESLTTGQPRLHTGRQQVRAFDHRNVLRWFVESLEQLSPSVVLTIERPAVKGPGHQLDHAGPWLTMFTLKNGKIVNLVWMSC